MSTIITMSMPIPGPAASSWKPIVGGEKIRVNLAAMSWSNYIRQPLDALSSPTATIIIFARSTTLRIISTNLVLPGLNLMSFHFHATFFTCHFDSDQAGQRGLKPKI